MSEFLDLKEHSVLRIAKQVQKNSSQDKLPIKEVPARGEKKKSNPNLRGLSSDHVNEETSTVSQKSNVKGLSVLNIGLLNNSKSKEKEKKNGNQNVSPTDNYVQPDKDYLPVEKSRHSSMVNHSFKKINKL